MERPSPRLLVGLAGLVGAGGLAWLAWKLSQKTKRVRVAALYIYPVKGCRGHSFARAKMTKWGLEDDRIYMVVDEKDEFVSQRSFPRMALIKPDMPTEKGITLQMADGSERIHVPLDLTSPAKKVKVWEDWVPAIDQGDSVSLWLCKVLQAKNLRLVRISSDAQRATDAKYGLGETAFSDGFPVLVSSAASMARVSRQVQREGGPLVGIDRFRPNLHLEGCRAWEEDEMSALIFARQRFSEAPASPALRLPLVKPCSRCTVPGIDPATGQRNRSTGGVLTEVMRRLRAAPVLAARAVLHKDFFAEAKRVQDVYFGQNALVQLQGGEHFYITVGDVAEVEWK